MKTRLYFLMAPVLLAGINPAVAQSTLGIVPTNNQALLFWTANAGGTNGILQSSASLTSANWVTATDAIPATYVPYSAVAVALSQPARLFRLLMVPPTADGMALVPAGSFTIGDDTGDVEYNYESNPANVYVSAFYMDTNLVSYSQWQTIFTYAINTGYGFDNGGAGRAASHPVHTVNWYDCVKWCNARSQAAGLTPVYYTDAGLTQVYMSGRPTVYPNWTANGYRLPTEAEWEKAARAGLSGQRYPWGPTISESQANYWACVGCGYNDLGPYSGYNTNFATGDMPYTSPVGYFPPNGYGLYDMAGNVFEWCWDWYWSPGRQGVAAYGLPTTNDPTGPASGIGRVLRGGAWHYNADNARSNSRYNLDPRSTVDYPWEYSGTFGFRSVRRP